MVYKPRIEETRPGKALVQSRQWGVAFVALTVGAGLLATEIQRLSSTTGTVLVIGYIAVFGLTGALIYLWIWSSSKELDLCFAWLDPERYAPPSSAVESMMIVGLGVLLSLLLFAARNPLWYSALFSSYSLVTLFAFRHARNEIGHAIHASRVRIKAESDSSPSLVLREYANAVDVLDEYFCLRPR